MARAERSSPEDRREDERKSKKDARERTRMDPHGTQGSANEKQSPYRSLRKNAEQQREGIEELEIQIPAGPHLGDVVIEAKNVRKGFDDKILMDDLTFRLPPGGIVGVIGPNGAGKTTLFRMITGQDKPDSGELKIGDTVQLGYVDQSRDTLDDNASVYQEISEGNDVLELGKRKINARAYVNTFNFRGGDQEKKVGVLSGGERNRVHLAKLLRKGSNVLLLDVH
jgi:ATPase subunit of ABC transporter with duplicated ATPase domains